MNQCNKIPITRRCQHISAARLLFPIFGRKKSNLLFQIKFQVIFFNWNCACNSYNRGNRLCIASYVFVPCENPYLNDVPHFPHHISTLSTFFCAWVGYFFRISTFPANFPLLHFKWLKQSVLYAKNSKSYCNTTTISKVMIRLYWILVEKIYFSTEYHPNMEYSKCLLSRKIRLWFRVKSNISHITYVDWQFSLRFSCIKRKKCLLTSFPRSLTFSVLDMNIYS